MLEYTIITILVIALGGTYWRKRVWKKRAKAGYLGFWGMIDGWRKEAESTPRLIHYGQLNKVPFNKTSQQWPEIIDDK